MKAAGIRKTNYSGGEACKVTSEWNRIRQVISKKFDSLFVSHI